MEPDDLALSDVHVSEYHRKIGFLKVDLGPDHNTTVTPGHTDLNTQQSKQSPSSDEFLKSDQGFNNVENTDPPDKSLKACYEMCRSRFIFESESEDMCRLESSEVTYDEDGDLVVDRQVKAQEVIYIDHTLGTRLKHVGLQVWQGALLLCDFILEHQKEFLDATALELGGGVGLASVVMATIARKVICTDVGDSLLALCERNSTTNQLLYRNFNKDQENIILVRELDWTKEDFTQVTGSAYHWRPDDLPLIDETTVLFAADVIYDTDLTTAFFKTVINLMSKPPNKTLYLALERRLNFTLDNLDVACPAYEHFLSCLRELDIHNVNGLQITACQLQYDFPQRFQYNRTEHLVLWKIQSTLEKTYKHKDQL